MGALLLAPLSLLAVASVEAQTPSSAAAKIPSIEIAKGVHMPLVGLGLWQYNSSTAEKAVTEALQLGYPLIDHALGYKNADGVARALKASSRPRSSYFVATKIPGGLSYADATSALELVLKQLGLSYVDLVSTHYPAGWTGSGGGTAARREQWRALEDFHAKGKARSLGVSHYCAVRVITHERAHSSSPPCPSCLPACLL